MNGILGRRSFLCGVLVIYFYLRSGNFATAQPLICGLPVSAGLR
ncbi:MAG: hypothetical protein ACLU9S_08440 [Oscillospiraceae bacterium]